MLQWSRSIRNVNVAIVEVRRTTCRCVQVYGRPLMRTITCPSRSACRERNSWASELLPVPAAYQRNVHITCHSSTQYVLLLLGINIRFFVRTVPEWNSLPEACVNADTVTAFQTQLRHTPWAVCTPPHRPDTRKWSDDYWTRTRIELSLVPPIDVYTCRNLFVALY